MNAGVVDRDRPQKLYRQLLDILRAPIERGEWQVGTRIPTEEQLCGKYRVSKTTVRTAIEELTTLGYVDRVQGKGTFVKRRIPEGSLRMAIHLDAERMEFAAKQRYQVIEDAAVPPDAEITDYLGLDPEAPCWHLLRLHLLDVMPLALEDLYVPLRLCVRSLGGQETAALPAWCIEGRCALKIQRLREKTDLRWADEQEGRLLGVSPGTPLLRIRQFFYQAGDRPLGFATTLRRIDSLGRVLEFERL